MRIGLLGDTDHDESRFREGALFLLGDAEADQVVFLGQGDFLEKAIGSWAEELGGKDAEYTFLREAASVAPRGTPQEIESLLDSDVALARLALIRKLPPPPARAIEMIDDRLILFVHDKSILDEEDIANAHLIVYGRSKESDLRRFGKRTFFTPGPLSGGRVGVLESADEGVTIGLYDFSGAPIWREALAQAGTKVTVAT